MKVHLTRSGHALVETLNELAVTHQNRFLNQLHPTELRALKGNIQKLLKAVDIDSTQLWKHV